MDVDLAVVTGGAGGLGRLITQRLAERRSVDLNLVMPMQAAPFPC
jgi:NAD(P)-dependent dehydrogenase (short-subunit alcohol dehydrogenase family)